LGFAFARVSGRPPLVLGHRGARRRAPENTLTAFDLAIEEGAAGVELDVRLDGSGNVVVFHDRTLQRFFPGDRRAMETLSSADVARLRFDGDERVPRLDDVLDWAARGGYLVNVEVKRDLGPRRNLLQAVAARLRAFPKAEELILLSSFDPAFVRALRVLVPRVSACWLVHAKQRVLKHAPGWRMLGAQGVNPELAVATSSRVEGWKKNGALVNVWTVNDGAEARRLSRAGVDTLISDVPGEIVRALASE
jgi:glycerophosphoryl diester phosphodiesterase